MILLASHQPELRHQWADALAGIGSVAHVDHVSRIAMFLANRPVEVLVLHSRLPGLAGSQGVAALKRSFPDTRVMMLSDVPAQAEGLAFLRAGADGYGNAHMAARLLRRAVEVVQLGEVWIGRQLLRALVPETARPEPADPLAELSERERQVALVVASGASNREVAERLGITERTVKSHLTAVFRKVGVKDRTRLALLVNRSLSGNEPGSAAGPPPDPAARRS